MQHHSISTQRLHLRTLTEMDASGIHHLFPNEFKTEEAALSHIRWIHNNGYDNRYVVNFYIWLIETGQLIGRVYLHSKPEIDGEIEIGYGISETHRNMGYATEAARAAVRFGFDVAGHDTLVAIVKPENFASRRVIEKLAFTRHEPRMVPDEEGAMFLFDYFRLSQCDWRALEGE